MLHKQPLWTGELFNPQPKACTLAWLEINHNPFGCEYGCPVMDCWHVHSCSCLSPSGCRDGLQPPPWPYKWMVTGWKKDVILPPASMLLETYLLTKHNYLPSKSCVFFHYLLDFDTCEKLNFDTCWNSISAKSFGICLTLILAQLKFFKLLWRSHGSHI